jgi:UDP-2,3-diacylglucosamine hydrolase
MTKVSKIYFASDFHLGAPNDEKSKQREILIISWLDTIKKDATDLYLLGDVFDFWYEWKYTVPKGFTRLLGKLAELSDLGININFFTGNHDLWSFGYLEQEIGLKIHRKPQEITLQNKTCYLAHGDGLGYNDKGYRLLKKLFTSKLCQWLFSRLHPNNSIAIAHYFSKLSRASNGDSDAQYKGDDKEWLVNYANEILKTKQFDYFIFGHRHIPLNIKLSENSTYVNLGEWINYNSYAVLENGNLQLLFYKSKYDEALNIKCI